MGSKTETEEEYGPDERLENTHLGMSLQNSPFSIQGAYRRGGRKLIKDRGDRWLQRWFLLDIKELIHVWTHIDWSHIDSTGTVPI